MDFFCYINNMLKEIIKEKKNRAKFYESLDFMVKFDDLKNSVDSISIIDNAEFCQVIDSIFEIHRKQIFYKSYKVYGLLYEGLYLYKFYHADDILYLVKTSDSDFLNITC